MSVLVSPAQRLRLALEPLDAGENTGVLDTPAGLTALIVTLAKANLPDASAALASAASSSTSVLPDVLFEDFT